MRYIYIYLIRHTGEMQALVPFSFVNEGVLYLAWCLWSLYYNKGFRSLNELAVKGKDRIQINSALRLVTHLSRIRSLEANISKPVSQSNQCYSSLYMSASRNTLFIGRNF